MRRTQIASGITVLTLGILSVVAGIRATEPPEVDANGNAIGEPFAPEEGARISLPLQTGENLSYGAVTESSTAGARAKSSWHFIRNAL